MLLNTSYTSRTMEIYQITGLITKILSEWNKLVGRAPDLPEKKHAEFVYSFKFTWPDSVCGF